MLRPATALVVLLCCLSSATATVSGRKDLSAFDKTPPAALKTFPAQLVETASARHDREQFLLTEETEVLLDGRPCKYQEVPRNVNIILLEVGSDKKTILRIHFQTRK
jgi:hypothetical protein